jgi:sporulation protein YlmC with PRC-barrel domain
MAMEFPLNVDVHCPDGRCGRSTHIIFNPTTEQVTHLVVMEQWPSRVERVVPVSWVAATTREVIVLKQDREQFSRLAPFQQTDFIYTDVPHYSSDPKLTALWPYVVPSKRIVDEKTRRIPPGELAIRRGAKVQATDGSIGQVDEFMMDPETGNITHLVLRKSLLRKEKDVIIPVGQIDHTDEKTVYLKVDKKNIALMPGVSVKRRWK